jgi:hypothetical protein
MISNDTVWVAAYDPSMMRNTFGNPEAVKKVYNGFHP